jgi:lysyl-tRNA synthetase class I
MESELANGLFHFEGTGGAENKVDNAWVEFDELNCRRADLWDELDERACSGLILHETTKERYDAKTIQSRTSYAQNWTEHFAGDLRDLLPHAYNPHSSGISTTLLQELTKRAEVIRRILEENISDVDDILRAIQRQRRLIFRQITLFQ